MAGKSLQPNGFCTHFVAAILRKIADCDRTLTVLTVNNILVVENKKIGLFSIWRMFKLKYYFCNQYQCHEFHIAASGTSTTSSATTSSGQQQAQPITLQIHHTQQGPRFMIPSGQLSQLTGMIYLFIFK